MSSPLLSVVVPCYNERATVAELLGRVRAVPIDKEIIVVDDQSTDGSRDVVAQLATEWPVTLFWHRLGNTFLTFLLSLIAVGRKAA